MQRRWNIMWARQGKARGTTSDDNWVQNVRALITGLAGHYNQSCLSIWLEANTLAVYLTTWPIHFATNWTYITQGFTTGHTFKHSRRGLPTRVFPCANVWWRDAGHNEAYCSPPPPLLSPPRLTLLDRHWDNFVKQADKIHVLFGTIRIRMERQAKSCLIAAKPLR